MKTWAVFRRKIGGQESWEAIDVTGTDVTSVMPPSPPGDGWELLHYSAESTAVRAIEETQTLDDAGLLESDYQMRA